VIRDEDPAVVPPLGRKILLATATGLLTFIGSTLLDGQFKVALADQLILTALVGGVTLLAQFLVDFDARLHRVAFDASRRLDAMETRQQENATAARHDMNLAFERISKATRFFTLIEKSALQTDALTQLVHHSGQINGANPQLVRDLAHYEIDRLSDLMKSLSSGDEVFYDGEDREWLLGLATHVSSSIMATSLATVDAGGRGFEGGLWMNDLGGRYLQIQRSAVQRGVQIRRIFVFDKPEFAADTDFIRIRHLQQDAGVQVKVLDNSMVPEHLKSMIFDFVLFDEVISYETTPATRMEAAVKPAIVTTRLILKPERVSRLGQRFEELWTAAQELD
jgi:uncharacterized protein DUF6879